VWLSGTVTALSVLPCCRRVRTCWTNRSHTGEPRGKLGRRHGMARPLCRLVSASWGCGCMDRRMGWTDECNLSRYSVVRQTLLFIIWNAQEGKYLTVHVSALLMPSSGPSCAWYMLGNTLTVTYIDIWIYRHIRNTLKSVIYIYIYMKTNTNWPKSQFLERKLPYYLLNLQNLFKLCWTS
jgi:hypothetical protein